MADRKEYYKKYHQENKEKKLAYWKKYAEENKDKVKEKERNKQIRKYGITVEQYEEMLKAQNGLCFICGKSNNTKRLSIDHDHKTGRVRGLLCDKCNAAIGLMNDDKNLFQKAIEYLSGIK